MGAFFDDLNGRIISALLLFFPRLFPRLAGPHHVGVLRARLSESVFAQISYPAVKGTGAITRYLRRPVTKGLADYLKMRKIFFSPLTTARHPCEFEAQPEQCGEKWPVAIFSHGLGGCAEMYSLFSAEMASHGVVVVALEHEDGSGCFAQTIDSEELILYKRPSCKYNRENVVGFRAPFLEQRCGEVRSAVSALQSLAAHGASDVAQLAALCASADLSRVHLVGHSFGGATAVLAAQQPIGVPVASVALFDPWAFSLPDDALLRGVDVPVATSAPLTTCLLCGRVTLARTHSGCRGQSMAALG
eukprot:6195725-Pleurochrysis_carterae.AAC.6